MAAGLSLWPAYSNDIGSGKSGTIINVAFLDSIKAAILDNIYDAGNPTVSLNTLIAEIIGARGSKATIDQRLDILLNEDGTPKAGFFPVTADAQSLLSRNYVANDTLIHWPSTVANAFPMYWKLTGGGTFGSMARTGAGLGDTTAKGASYAAKMVTTAGPVQMYQDILTSMAIHNDLPGRTFTFGMWVKTSTASLQRVFLDDGISTTYSSVAHTGSGNFEWLTVVKTFSGAATRWRVGFEAGAASTAYMGVSSSQISNLAPTAWVPSLREVGVEHVFISGAQTVANGKAYFSVPRPVCILDVVGQARTAPTGANLIYSLATPNPAAAYLGFNTVTFNAGNNLGGTTATANYERSCMIPLPGSGALGEGQLCRVDCTQIGSGVAGSDVDLFIYYETIPRVFEEAWAARFNY